MKGMKNIKNILYTVVSVIMIGLIIGCIYFGVSGAKYKKLYLKELTNVKAYQSENSDLKGQSIVHLMTIEQLQASKDSTDKALTDALKKLNIKPKNVISAGTVTSNIEKRDSVIFKHDTIFQSKVDIDTLIGDKWYKAQVGLHYPARIDLSVSMKSVKHIVVHSKKETINPPKKFWLWRLFQKKHTLITVSVDEENPHIEAGSQKFVQIVK